MSFTEDEVVSSNKSQTLNPPFFNLTLGKTNMSGQTNIVAFDGAATPVSHTLVAIGVSVDPKTNEYVALYREGITTLPVYAQITCELRMRRLPTGVYRVQQTTEVPIMEAVNGQNSAGYTAAPKLSLIHI